jgi:TrmH family RNA methyltransferase
VSSETKKRLRIVLVQPRNPLNIGAAARAMFNFGFEDLWLVEPRDQAFRQAKSAMGAAKVLQSARVTSSIAEALGEASLVAATSSEKGRSTDMVQKELTTAGHAIRTHLEDRSVAILFGPEQDGLSREDVSRCDWLLEIPTNPECPSMNLGQAVALVCYEIARHARAIPELKTPASVSAAERDRILGLLLPLLNESGFIFNGSEEAQTNKIRRWITRLRLAPADSQLLMAMLRQLRWKFDHDAKD